MHLAPYEYGITFSYYLAQIAWQSVESHWLHSSQILTAESLATIVVQECHARWVVLVDQLKGDQMSKWPWQKIIVF